MTKYAVIAFLFIAVLNTGLGQTPQPSPGPATPPPQKSPTPQGFS